MSLLSPVATVELKTDNTQSIEDAVWQYKTDRNPKPAGQAAFKAYHATAELAEATDPNLILDLKTKLDAQGHYDEFEIDRVVKVLLDPTSKQSQLQSALEPVA